jgi:leucine dehydrogenase
MIGYNEAKAFQQVHNIYDTLIEIFKIAKQQNITTNDASKQLAENRIINAKKTKINEIAA